MSSKREEEAAGKEGEKEEEDKPHLLRRTVYLYQKDIDEIKKYVEERRYISFTDFVRRAVQEKIGKEKEKAQVY